MRTVVYGKGQWEGWIFTFEAGRLVGLVWPEPTARDLAIIKKLEFRTPGEMREYGRY